jgi:alkaline phosphatase D
MGDPGDPVLPRLSRRAFLALSVAVVVGCTGDDDSAPTTGPDTAPTTPTTTGGTTAPPTPPSTTPATTGGTEPPAPPTTVLVEPQPALAADPFALGVASGDPDATSVVLWTRLIGADLPDEVEVAWDVVDDIGTVVRTGMTSAAADTGHAVHVVLDVDGPTRFRFRAGGGWTSTIGSTQPATPRDELRIASASCQHFETGFYAAHRDLAEWEPDLVVFLGDFMYEGSARAVGGDVVRSHEGDEPTTLEAYRTRYAQYLGDLQLQRARAVCPWLVVWDDHEVENNYAGLVPQLTTESDAFPARRAQAYRAWWEHMPTRLDAPDVDAPSFEIHRGVDYGDLVRLSALDGRQHRSVQACGSPVLDTQPACAEASDPARTMLGDEQEAWLADRFASSIATWHVVAQQTVMTDLRLENGAILNYDQWDGYAPARDRLLAGAPEGLVVLSGDIHFAGVGRLAGKGVEFVATSISSVGNVDPALQPLIATFQDVVDVELEHRGYTRHVVTPTAWVAEYRTVTDVADPDSEVTTWRSFRVAAGSSEVAVAED